MSDETRDPASIAKRELLILAIFFAGGLTLLPAAVYLVGQMVFGEYPGGLSGFLREIWSSLVSANPATWFLVLSPYLVWLASRVTWQGMRSLRRRTGE